MLRQDSLDLQPKAGKSPQKKDKESSSLLWLYLWPNMRPGDRLGTSLHGYPGWRDKHKFFVWDKSGVLLVGDLTVSGDFR